jgi:hypothetical protein
LRWPVVARGSIGPLGNQGSGRVVDVDWWARGVGLWDLLIFAIVGCVMGLISLPRSWASPSGELDSLPVLSQF